MAEVILRSGGVRDRAGTLEASTFLIDMNRLFERFITFQLRRLLAGKLEVRDQEQTHLDVGHKTTMYPDLVFYRRSQPVLVADVKYKLTDDGLGRNGDYYQLLAYCSALELHRGVLIYSGEDHASTVNQVVAGGPCLELRCLDLAGTRSNIGEAIAVLASELRDLAWPAHPSAV